VQALRVDFEKIKRVIDVDGAIEWPLTATLP